MEGFSFTVPVSVRYTDVDTYGHVNNAVYATYLEEARIAYFEHVVGQEAGALLGTAEGEGIVIANLEMDFRTPIGFGDDVTVGVRVPELGGSSIPMEYEIRADGDVAAVAESTAVAYDRRDRSSMRIPDVWRTAIEEFEGL